MTGRPVTLEEFGRTARAGAAKQVVVGEADRLAAFEDGYKAGWDDAAAAQETAEKRIAADLAANLEDLAFTFHEAHGHVLKGVEPLIRQLVAKVLPEIARHALPQIVAETAMAAAREAASAPAVILCAPESRDRIEAMLPADPGFPLTVREEATLTGGQAFIRLGEIEHRVDMDGALREISQAVDDFFTLNDEKAQAHG